MLKETEETVGYVLIFLSLRVFQLEGPAPLLGYVNGCHLLSSMDRLGGTIFKVVTLELESKNCPKSLA